jgi:outer membrane protein assembly factor BamB
MRRHLLALLTLAGATLALTAGEWPCFRGPHGNGVADEKTFPLEWGPDKNVAWKVKLPGPGASSPVIWGERVFVTAFSGVKASEIVRHVLCFDRKTGNKLWQKDYPAPLPENDYKAQVSQHGMATSTPATDGKRLYLWFGRGGLHVLDLDGKPLWQAELGSDLVVFGSGASPLLLGDKVIVNAGVESHQLVALDRTSGKVLWKSDINGMCWSTPVVVRPAGGKDEIVLNVGAGLYGYDAETGKELWCADILAAYNGATPVIRDGIVYVMNQGQGEREFVAVRAGGRGDVTKTHVIWRQSKAGASYTSPLLAGDRLFSFGGQASVLRADNGEVVTRKNLQGLMGLYGSPILAGDRIVVFTRFDGAYVLSADDKLEVLARNKLGDDSAFNASPALVDGQLIIRSNEYLYCIGKKERTR